LFAEVLDSDDICLCGMMAAEVASLKDPARAALKDFFATSERWLEDVFTAHQDELSSALSPQELARIFMSGLEGATLIERVDTGKDRLAAWKALTRALVS
ncbi:MAG: TetR family transcriptional regulator C-terminal domain-containing protein, partial [Pseudomonadota bacterium]